MKIIESWPQLGGGVRYQVVIATRTHGEVTVLVDAHGAQLTTTVLHLPGAPRMTQAQERRWMRAARAVVCA